MRISRDILNNSMPRHTKILSPCTLVYAVIMDNVMYVNHIFPVTIYTHIYTHLTFQQKT